MLEILHGITDDGLRLQGFHWSSEFANSKDTCVVFTHGMSGNIVENYFAQILGEDLSADGYGFLYGHNRGHGHINDVTTTEIDKNGGNKFKRCGTSFERFEESIYDVDMWVNQAKKLGYSNIVLVGFSLGANKVINYLAKTPSNPVDKLILLSPPDMVGLEKIEKYQSNYPELLQKAKENMNNGNDHELLYIWDCFYISSQTFLDLFEDGCPADNLPLYRNPEKFEQLSSIQIPIFTILGELDDIVVNSLEDDIDQIKTKATSCKDFSSKIIQGATHIYQNREKQLAQAFLDWLNR